MHECRDVFLSFFQKTWRGWLKESGRRSEGNIKIEIKNLRAYVYAYVTMWAGFIRFRA